MVVGRAVQGFRVPLCCLMSGAGLFRTVFLAWWAVMARNEWASIARVICRCQASYFRT